MLLLAIILSFVLIIFYIKQQYSRWETEGFKFLPPQIPFGNLKSIAYRTRSFGLAVYDLYRQTKEPFIGIYLFFRPAILIRDAKLVKNILVRDFDYFHDRGVYCDDVHDKFSANLFALPGEKWRSLRQTLTPAFTSGKLKSMFKTLLDVGDKLKVHLDPLAERNEIIELKSLSGRYVAEVLASVAFGIEANSINDPSDPFVEVGQRQSSPTKIIDSLRAISVFLCPQIIKFLRIQSLPKFMREFCLNIVKTTVDYREKDEIFRNDLIQYLIQLKNIENLSQLNEWRVKGGLTKNMDIEEISAQVFLFYIAGTETSSSLVAYTLYELSLQPELMKKVKTEIKTVLAKYNNEISYDCIQEMKFLDLCIQEILRMYPGLPILNRVCTKDYKIPGSNQTIKKGTPIIISLMGQHRDAAYFPNPDKFDPDRFSDEHQNYEPYAYMPFGDGPRNCIAFRMGKMVGKLAMALLLSNYDFTCMEKGELEFSIEGVGLLPKNGIKMQISKSTS